MSVCLSVYEPMAAALFVFSCRSESGVERSQKLKIEGESEDYPPRYAASLALEQTCAGASNWARV